MADKLRILLIGSGGREHALAWKLSQSARVESIHVCPGNGGTDGVAKCTNIISVSSEDFSALADYIRSSNINFVIPGPEAPLVAGIADYIHAHAPGVHIFGPSRTAAQLEGSKTFSKDFMQRHSIPTARYQNFSNYEDARRHLESVDYEIVIKADGLAAGKGVILPQTPQEGLRALKEIMLDKEFGSAGNSVVIEERLSGEEISILSLTDGETILSLPPAQDHKRIGDGDTGPNTGGMGTYAPTPFASQEVLARIEREVLLPTIRGMQKEGTPFRGCLFTGLMLTPQGPKVLEYNVRFGDPETQSVLPLVKSDLADLMFRCCSPGALAGATLDLSSQSACTVVMAAKGYPGAYEKGTPITLQPPPKASSDGEGTFLFHAGTNLDAEGQLRTSGGRVIAATATGETLTEAVDAAYKTVRSVNFEGMQCRRDIAARALGSGLKPQRGIFEEAIRD